MCTEAECFATISCKMCIISQDMSLMCHNSSIVSGILSDQIVIEGAFDAGCVAIETR